MQEVVSVPETGGTEAADRAEVQLACYGVRLAGSVRSLLAHPLAELRVGLTAMRDLLDSLGPRVAVDTRWLVRRESYLADADARLLEGTGRVEVALSAPRESDLATTVVALRSAVGYLGDVSAELIPAETVHDLAGALPPVGRDLAAPRLYLQMLSLVELALARSRSACVLAAETTEKVDRILAEPVPGIARTIPPPRDVPVRRHPGEIDALLAALERRRSLLAARPRESPEDYDRALREWFHLTSGQLSSALRRHLPPPSARPRNG